MNIMVIGWSGSGKSTLAAALGRRYGLPVLHIDTIGFINDVRQSDASIAQGIADIMLHSGWVTDGNWVKAMWEERLQAADAIVLLDFPYLLCLYGLLKRSFQRKHEEMNVDGALIPFQVKGFQMLAKQRRDHTERFKQLKQNPKVIVLRSRKQVNAWLAAGACESQ